MSEAATQKFVLCSAVFITLGILAFSGDAQAQGQSPTPAAPAAPAAASPPDLSGNYQCKPNPDPCLWSGDSASISQSGNMLQIKGTNGAAADAMLTSDTTISASATFNSIGIIRPDHSIDWSDGTKWSKQ
jgi:hypothetical protein